jgi:chorismate dehydratase
MKIRVGAVSYLNTRPLLYGIRHHSILNEIELIEDYPSRIGQLLIENKIDLGLIPIAALPQLEEFHIISDYCIGAVGPVTSVCIFSEVPMEDIKKVYLDYQSKTSVSLAKILLRDYWKKEVVFVQAQTDDFRKLVTGDSAAVIIGDRALEQGQSSRYAYDLSEAWKKHTGLPFVFAAWVANKKLPEQFNASFNEANAYGLQHLDAVIKETNTPDFDLKTYYTSHISYYLDEKKREGMTRFLELLKSLKLVASF